MTRIKVRNAAIHYAAALHKRLTRGPAVCAILGLSEQEDESCNRVAMQAEIPFFRDDSLQLKHFLQIHREIVTYLRGSLEGFTLLCSSLTGRRQRSLCAEVSRLKRRLLEQATNLINDAVAAKKQSPEKRTSHSWWIKLRHSESYEMMSYSLLREIVDGEENLFRQYQSLVSGEGDSIVAVILNDHVLITRNIIKDLQRELNFVKQPHARLSSLSSSSGIKPQSFGNSATDSQ